jgi:hypothetical protein
MADRTESVVLDFEVDEKESIESIKSLTEANKKLRAERNELNIATEAGKKRAAELNKQIDANTDKIKANVSALEKQKINIGNYKSALDGVNPALGKVADGLDKGVQGFKAMTLQALRFIATPIGAILAALVAVFALLKSAISSNNNVLDKFENVTNAVGVVLDVIISRVGKLGEALIALATGDFTGALNLAKEAFTGLGDAMAVALRQGQLYLDLSRELEDSQRALAVQAAKQENEIRRLVVASKNRNLTLDESEGLLRQALKLEDELVKKREENAFKDLVITTKQIALQKGLQQTSEETFDQFVSRLLKGGVLADDQADKITEKLVALESARGSSLAFQEKLENQLTTIQEKRAEAIKKQTEALREQEAQERATRRAQSGGDATVKDPELDAEFKKAEIKLDINERLAKDIAKINKKQAEEDKANAEKSIAIEKMKAQQELQIAGNTFGALADLSAEDSIARKGFATAEALVNTYLSATAALASGSEINPVFGIIAAATAVATGLANVAKINGVEFAEGGWTGPGHKYQPVGIVHADEYVVPKHINNHPAAQHHIGALEQMRMRGYADGGYTARSVSQPINQSMEVGNLLKNLGPFEVSAKEITKVQNRIKVKEKISKR